MNTLPGNGNSATTSIFKKPLGAGSAIDIRTNAKAVKVNRLNKPTPQTYGSLIDSKLVKPKHTRADVGHSEDDLKQYTQSAFSTILEDRALSKKEAEAMIEAIPNLRLAADILISSMTTPNDTTDPMVLYNIESDLFKDMAPVILKPVVDHFNNVYDIKSKISDWLKRSLVTEGSVPLMVIPESAIDHAINQNHRITKEDFNKVVDEQGRFKTKGVLGTPHYLNPNNKPHNPFEITLESAFRSNVPYQPQIGVQGAGINVQVTDNINAFNMIRLYSHQRDLSLGRIYGEKSLGLDAVATTESASNKDVYPEREFSLTSLLALAEGRELKRETKGHPVVFDLPSEAVIPIHEPSAPENHVGYFVAIDENGVPLIGSSGESQYRQFQKSGFNVSGSATSENLINTAQQMGVISSDKYDKKQVDDMASIYASVVEKDLMQRLESGRFDGRGVSLGDATELYKLMYMRTLANLSTQLVFVPKGYMTYIAFSYNDNGTGRSLLEQTKIHGSLRMLGTMVAAIANAKSAIDHRKVTIRLDGRDQDPIRRASEYMHEFARSTKAQLPIGQGSLSTIADYLQSAGVNVNIEGHEGVPDMGMDVESTNVQYTQPDQTYMESLEEQHYQGLGLPPEVVRSATGVDFAIQLVFVNAIYRKVALERSNIATMHITDHVKKFVRNSEPLTRAIVEAVKANRKSFKNIDEGFSDEVIARVAIEKLSVSLPTADIDKHKQQLEAFENQSRLVDQVVESYISSELYSNEEMGEKASEHIDRVATVLKSELKRRWLSDNTVLPAIHEFLNGDGTINTDMIDTHVRRSGALGKIVNQLMGGLHNTSKHTQDVFDARDKLTGEDSDSSDGYGSSGDDDSNTGDSQDDGDVSDGNASDGIGDDSNDDSDSADSMFDDADEGDDNDDTDGGDETDGEDKDEDSDDDESEVNF